MSTYAWILMVKRRFQLMIYSFKHNKFIFRFIWDSFAPYSIGVNFRQQSIGWVVQDIRLFLQGVNRETQSIHRWRKKFTTISKCVNIYLRRGKKIDMVLVLCFLKMCARVREIFFFIENSYQLTNIDLALKDRVCERFETKFHYFIATSY